MLFEVWAPRAERVALYAEGEAYAMERDPARDGWWRCAAPGADGTRYGFALDGGPVLPDPRSRRQPDGPDGLGAVVDFTAFPPLRKGPGVPLSDAVLYELHVGTFTGDGTFDAAAARLPHLVDLGVTHVELMPVCPFPGTHGWGYEGVSPWAVHEPYGGPAGLRRFVAAAHGLGLGVVLDVVHNHLGPSGNHLPAFGPYFTDTHHTPWGAAVNLDAPGSAEVRAYLTGSALAWLRDYGLDGLRLDAVHALADSRTPHFLAELSAAVDGLAERLGRPLLLIAESDLNDPVTTAPRAAGGHGVHAQWNDDFHHALHTLLTGESQGFYADFAADPARALAKTLTGGFFHDGTYSSFRGRRHGRPLDPGAVHAYRLLGYAQTHDQIGNRALGDRLSARLSPGLLACAGALVLCSPFTPMLFMGEEWGARTPWQFFTDHTDPHLARAVREGRRREFAAHGWSAEEVPDPQDPATRERSCLDWSEPEREPHRELLAWHRRLIALRRDTVAGRPSGTGWATRVTAAGRRVLLRRGDLCVLVNASGETASFGLEAGGGPYEVLAAWRPVEPPGRDGVCTVPAESAVVLRGAADSASGG
ncbi:malto-oligosyltrehalose trehalohydrolase [Streptomyces sp. UNOC14_S4]|uniref:malto-oligosyltrehalose trehalohydrolase n=1 Tax=Streptomyces sp. UNOC14_S4 TaxID=2872340 RepID=UPI001E45CD9A|nr:malto-oligosyltrehalose trehalohydrolase [Streptomyces sp. UNOC14_S4]MCC3770118.1 malto-oligosyltrehalose trehalohydrolase [Streptomyces sp. UNOC14_S4]